MDLKLSLKENISSAFSIKNKIEAKQIFPTKVMVELALWINPRMQIYSLSLDTSLRGKYCLSVSPDKKHPPNGWTTEIYWNKSDSQHAVWAGAGMDSLH